jgi:ankyrin repeat protein
MGNEALASLLCDHGADPNTEDNAGVTPLHLALKSGRDYMLGLLLAHGADPCAPMNYLEAFEMCASHFPYIALMLVEAMANAGR